MVAILNPFSIFVGELWCPWLVLDIIVRYISNVQRIFGQIWYLEAGLEILIEIAEHEVTVVSSLGKYIIQDI